ncbi:MAG: hypothetical protein RIS70_236 [Planctomycetota bacterium]
MNTLKTFPRRLPHVYAARLQHEPIRWCLFRVLASIAFLIGSEAILTRHATAQDFAKDVRPILEKRCFACHGPTKRSSGYRLDVRAAAMRGGETGQAAIVPHDAKASPLFRYISGQDEAMQMPPRDSGVPRLTAQELATIRKWIDNGPTWPDEHAGGDVDRRKHWAWQPIRQPEIPRSDIDPIDGFIRAKLAADNLVTAAPADDRTWLRRVYFAIIGLPPSLEDLHAFLADPSSERRARVVDRLLESPHFGERWARHWMDLMRYAESRGHESDFGIANAWRYRDYLIRAFNADVPYDRFLSEHIAGDLIPARLDPTTGANESIQGTGWAFLGEEVHSPVDILQDERERIDNKIDVLSKTFLGLTVACARCHDHKFDAITQRDYYGLCGFIVSSSFRQARFETMEQHAQVAEELEALRVKHRRNIAGALAKSVRPGLAKTAAYLAAARRNLAGAPADSPAGIQLQERMRAEGLDSKQLAAWTEQWKQALSDPTHPFHLFARLAAEPAVENESQFSQRVARYIAADEEVADDFATHARVIADFTEPGQTPWKVDGPTFGRRLREAGEIMLGTSAAEPLERVMPYGGAVADPFWKSLKLTADNELDSGRLGAALRSGRTLVTPRVRLTSGRLHYLLRGKASVYAGVDSHLMIEGPLHGSLVAGFDAGSRPRWVTHDLSLYAGHFAHLEFSPQGDAGLDVMLVVESDHPPSWVPQVGWRPEKEVKTFDAMAKSLQSDLMTAAAFLEDDKLVGQRRLAPLASWIVQNRILLGADNAMLASLSEAFFQGQAALAKAVRWESRTAISWQDGAGVEDQVLARGKADQAGEFAWRSLPAALGFPVIHRSDSSGRAELAQQLIDPDNPLVSRVIVNRVWQQLFGRGIVATPDNFGAIGEPPTHPELLDYLAWTFRRNDGWSIKRLIRRMVLTDTFAMSSRPASEAARARDPANLLLHCMPVRRLEGEAIRDAMLVVSGQLNASQSGPPVPVHLTEFIVGRGRPDTSGPLDGKGRRSIYTSLRRNFLPTMMVAFDFPTPFSTVGRRNVTNVPAQSLVMMNDPFVHQQAAAWAGRLLRELPRADDSARVQWLFETGFGRPAEPEEIRLALESLSAFRALPNGNNEVASWADLCHALFNASEFIYLK